MKASPWTTYSPEGLTWATPSLTLQRRKRIGQRAASRVPLILPAKWDTARHERA